MKILKKILSAMDHPDALAWGFLISWAALFAMIAAAMIRASLEGKP